MRPSNIFQSHSSVCHTTKGPFFADLVNLSPRILNRASFFILHHSKGFLVEVMGFTQVVQRLQHEGIHPEEDRQVHQIRMRFASPSLLGLLVEACQPV